MAGESFKLSSQKTEVQFESPPDKPVSMNLTSNQVVVDNIRFKKVTAQISLTPDKVILKKSTFTPAHGTLTAHGSYHTQSKKYKLEFLGKNLWAGDYTKNQVLGIMRTHGSVNGHIPEKLPGIRGLFGNVSLKISPVNFEKAEEIKTILAVIDPTFFRKQNTRGLRFDYLGGNFKIINGKFNTTQPHLEGRADGCLFRRRLRWTQPVVKHAGKSCPKIQYEQGFELLTTTGSTLYRKSQSEED